jgi:hypothetical protein
LPATVPRRRFITASKDWANRQKFDNFSTLRDCRSRILKSESAVHDTKSVFFGLGHEIATGVTKPAAGAKFKLQRTARGKNG